MALVFIGLGSNLGNGRINLTEAWKYLGRHPKITPLTLSSPYLSEPVGIVTTHWFTNAVGALETRLNPEELLVELLKIEKEMGRNRLSGQDRAIDLDILYYDDLLLCSSTLEIPHPELHKRLFVLAPLEELSPDHIHPASLLSSRSMRQTLKADYKVIKTTW
nr:2-amino-4-hydroxy-6-hydroxymethyldihydropteridine diphosphokinase [Desulfobulbaceae bacterium]